MRKWAAIVAAAVALAGVALLIEPGMHTAPIRRIGVDSACTLAVTGAEDSTVRLWALPEGGRGAPELLRTMRIPLGDGEYGKVYAVALSPEGKWVAAGGLDAHFSIDETGAAYIFEAATGQLVTRLRRLSEVINHLAFSPDGSRLAATLGGGEGMRLWETGGGLLAEDKDYGGKDGYGAAFDNANRLFTVAYDGQIRRYSAEGQLEAKTPAQGGKKPFSVAIHPQGGKLAIGFNDTAAVEVYDARTLKRLYAANTRGISGDDVDLGSVAWSADGARLYAGGHYRVEGRTMVVSWHDEGRGKRREAPLAQNTIMQLLPCDGGIAAAAQDPAFGLIAADGTKRVWHAGVIGDVRDMYEEFRISTDGKRVRFGLKQFGKDAISFDVSSFRVVDAADAPAGLAAPKTSGLAVSNWMHDYAPKLNGKTIARARLPLRRMHSAPCSARTMDCAPTAPMAMNFGESQVPALSGT